MSLNLKRAYEVHEVPKDQRSPRRVCTYAKGKGNKGGKFEFKEVPDDRRQFDVYFPHKHCIRVHEEELQRLGFTQSAGYVDMDTGELVQFGEQTTLRDMIERSLPARIPQAVNLGNMNAEA